MKYKKFIASCGAAALGIFFFTNVVSANHSWLNFHWARTANPFVIKLGNDLSSNWHSYLVGASTDWSLSTVLDTVIVPGSSSSRTCKPISGRVEVCNSRYGSNGWLGIASVWVSGDHITQATVKMNDSYFLLTKYNTPAWKNLVLCQEIGHTFGLDHQDENFNNAPLLTCMDYTNDPTPNQHPNLHDYEMLETIYAHTDTIATASSTAASSGQDVDHNDPTTWGREVARTSNGRDVRSSNGRESIYVRDLGNGNKVITHVFWELSK